MDTATTAPFDSGAFTEGSSKPFGGGTSRDQRYDNQPPLEDRVMLEFEEALRAPGDANALSIEGRIAELLEAAERAPETIDDDIWAGRVGDFLKLARVVEQRVDAAREEQNRPLINARNALKAKADSILHPLLQVGATLRSRLNAYVAREEAKRREAERLAAEAARIATEAAREAAPSPEFVPTVAPARVEKPVARGDLGSRVGGRTVMKFERMVPIKSLPKAILENAQVVEAVDKVIGQMVRGGARNPSIKGVNIYETTEASIR